MLHASRHGARRNLNLPLNAKPSRTDAHELQRPAQYRLPSPERHHHAQGTQLTTTVTVRANSGTPSDIDIPSPSRPSILLTIPCPLSCPRAHLSRVSLGDHVVPRPSHRRDGTHIDLAPCREYVRAGACPTSLGSLHGSRQAEPIGTQPDAGKGAKTPALVHLPSLSGAHTHIASAT